MRFFRKPLLILALLASSTVNAFNLLDIVDKNCRRDLSEPKEVFAERMHLTQSFLGFRIGQQAMHGGFYLETKKPTRQSKVREVTLPPLSQPFWKTENWQLTTGDVQFLSVGFQNLSHESDRLNQVVSDHVLEYPHDSLKINFDSSRSLAYKTIYNVRWHVHDMVLDTYTRRKKYITPYDLAQMVAYNRASSHNDVFVMMAPTTKSLEDMTFEEFDAAIIMTIQNSYFGKRNYLEPSLKGVLQANQLPISESEDMHAFEYRIPKHLLNPFRTTLYNRFNAETSCEIIRYVRFGETEGALHDYFLLRAITAAIERGCKTLFASADPVTARIFKGRYQFAEYGKLPGLKDEVLLYHDTDSDEFKAFYNRLALGSENVKVVE